MYCVSATTAKSGCLGACTYCKTKHARGELGSYAPEAIVARVRSAVREGVSEIWFSSEDTGAFGRDIGSSLSELLRLAVAELPQDCRTMLRLVRWAGRFADGDDDSADRSH